MNFEIRETRELRRSSRKRYRVHPEDNCSTSRKSVKVRKIQQQVTISKDQDLRINQSSSEEQDRNDERKIFYQDFECAICLETVTDPHIIPECCHRFCGPCIKESIKARNECSACRQHIPPKRSLRKDELVGKLLDRLQQLEKENEDLRSKLEMNEDENLPLSQPLRSDDENENGSDQHSIEIVSADSLEHGDSMEYEEQQAQPVVIAITRNESGNKFEARFAELQQFKNKHGHCNVLTKYKENPSLGIWCSKIRQMKSGSRKNVGVYKLTDDRIAKLEEIGFQWKVLATFEDRLVDLQQFKNEHGHCNVPTVYEENKSLGNWCSDIRRVKSGNRKNVGVYKLTDDRIAKLEDMGFRWIARKRGPSKTFEDRLVDLQQFKNEHGHCNVPTVYEENKSLGNWCSDIRRVKSGNRKNVGVYKLTDDRIAKLEDMGFRWIARKRGPSKTFEDRLVDLQQFKNEHGHCNVPTVYEENKSLGNWCCRIRQVKSGSHPNLGVFKLTDDRIAKLEGMGFQFP